MNPRPLLCKRYAEIWGNGWVDDEGWTEYEVVPQALKKGSNTLQLTLQPPEQGDPAEAVDVLEVRVVTTYV